MTKTLTVTTPSDREIALTRVFHASRDLVFDALTRPALVKRWMLGNMGASMPVARSTSGSVAPTASCGAIRTGRKWA